MRSIGTLAFVILVHLGHAQGLSWDEPLDVASADAGALRPRVVLNATDQPVVLWSLSSAGGCFAAVGVGSGFTAPMRVNPEGTEHAAADWQGPAIASAGSTIWAVYKGLPEHLAPCYVVGSTDGGFTWGDTLRVDPPDGPISRYPTIAVTGSGLPIVEYMQFTSGYLEPRHVVVPWMAGGFVAPVQVSAPFAPGEVCDCCTGELACAGDGVVALYRNAGGNIRTIWGAASVNGGMSFPVGAEVDATSWFLSACPSSGPDLYFAGDSIRYVWMSGEENGTKVYIGSAQQATLMTGVQLNVQPGQPQSVQQDHPRISGSGDTLGVVWEQYSGGDRDILFSWSVSGATGLSVPVVVNTGLAGQQRTPDIAFANGSFHIVWSEPASGQVRYRKAVINTGSAIEEGASSAMPLRFDAGAEQLVISGINARQVRITDLAEKELLANSTGSSTMALGVLAGGSYLAMAVDVRGVVYTLRFMKP